MLDDSPVHVDHVQRAVRGVRQVNRPEPLVRGAQELRAFIRLSRTKSRTVVYEDEPADDVRGGFGDEDVLIQVLLQPVTAVHRRRTRRSVGRKRAVRAQDALLVGAVGSRRSMCRPDDVDVATGILERFVAAASPEHRGVPREVGCWDQVHVQYRLVVIPIDSAGVVLCCPPLPARQ
jgi:hypothetical protein